jgi:hypothetical protein
MSVRSGAVGSEDDEAVVCNGGGVATVVVVADGALLVFGAEGAGPVENMLRGNDGPVAVAAAVEETGDGDVSGRYSEGGHLTDRVLCAALLTKAKYRLLHGANAGCVGPESPGGGSCATDCAVQIAEEEAAAAPALAPTLSCMESAAPCFSFFCDEKLSAGWGGFR